MKQRIGSACLVLAGLVTACGDDSSGGVAAIPTESNNAPEISICFSVPGNHVLAGGDGADDGCEFGFFVSQSSLGGYSVVSVQHQGRPFEVTASVLARDESGLGRIRLSLTPVVHCPVGNETIGAAEIVWEVPNLRTAQVGDDATTRWTEQINFSTDDALRQACDGESADRIDWLLCAAAHDLHGNYSERSALLASTSDPPLEEDVEVIGVRSCSWQIFSAAGQAFSNIPDLRDAQGGDEQPAPLASDDPQWTVEADRSEPAVTVPAFAISTGGTDGGNVVTPDGDIDENTYFWVNECRHGTSTENGGIDCIGWGPTARRKGLNQLAAITFMEGETSTLTVHWLVWKVPERCVVPNSMTQSEEDGGYEVDTIPTGCQ